MIGAPRVHFRVTDSTNERARTLAAGGAPHGTLVTADEQRTGRGRQGRTWSAPPRTAVLMSVVLHELSETLPLAAAVAVCEALPVEAQIKWPNDVWIGGRKVAGILVEGRPQEGWAVLGIGLNVSTEDALGALLAELRVWLPRPVDEVLAAWRSRDALLGGTVRWSNGSREGIAAGVDELGALIVETGDGRVTLDAGEVHLER